MRLTERYRMVRDAGRFDRDDWQAVHAWWNAMLDAHGAARVSRKVAK